MADIELVIKPPEEEYEDIRYFGTIVDESRDYIANIILSGSPLPKGHGNIYDENDIKKGIENPYQCQTVLNGLKLIKPILGADMEVNA